MTDLAGARDTYGVRRLIAETCARTRAALTEAHGVLEIATPDYQPLVRAGLSLWEHRLNEVERRGAAVLRRPVSTGIREPLSILLRETRERGGNGSGGRDRDRDRDRVARRPRTGYSATDRARGTPVLRPAQPGRVQQSYDLAAADLQRPARTASAYRWEGRS